MLRLWLIALVVSVVFVGPAAMAEEPDPEKLNAEIIKLYKAGKFTKAIPIARQILEITESRFGPDHEKVGTSLYNLAELYRETGQPNKAEPLYKRSIKIRRATQGKNHISVGTAQFQLARIYHNLGRFEESEALYQRSLAINEQAQGQSHPSVATILTYLGDLYKAMQRYGEAEPLYKRSLKIREASFGKKHPIVAAGHGTLAQLHHLEGRFAEAKKQFERSLEVFEEALGKSHPHVATTLNNFAELYRTQGLFDKAERLYKRSLNIRETALGPNHWHVGASLDNLAELFHAQGRYKEAEPLFKRSLKIAEKAFGRDHITAATSMNNLANLYRSQGRLSEAEPLLKRSLEITSLKLGEGHSYTGTSLNNLAELYRLQRRYGEAEKLYKRSLEITKKALGPAHPSVGIRFAGLALLHQAQGQAAEAEIYHKKALKITRSAYGEDHLDIAKGLNNLARISLSRQKWQKAAMYWKEATDLLVRRARRSTVIGTGITSKKKTEVTLYESFFRGLIKSVYREGASTVERKKHGAASFPTAQWALASEAAGALAQMSARSAANDQRLSPLIRERQDLVSEWQQRDQTRSKFASLPPGMRNKEKEAANTAALATIDLQIKNIDARLEKEFPDYAAIVNPVPLSVGETQELLSSDEAMVLFLSSAAVKPTPEETFIWVLTKEDMIWVRSPLGISSLNNMVKRLRCGLDVAGWRSNRKSKTNAPCMELTGQSFDLTAYYQGKASLPFETEIAHELYNGLFAKIKDKIKGKKLLLVPSGPLTSLPFQVLLSQKPKGGKGMKEMHWLIRDHALTVLPSVSSLKALRSNAKASAAKNPFLGFGNPLLLGRSGKDKTAWVKQSCKFQQKPKPLRLAGLTIPDAISKYFRGGRVNVELLKRQAPLPETADELCAVAETIGASPSAVHLGAKATEAEVKRLSKDGTLQQAKILHFATHGLLADETGQLLKNRAEPSLLLTPPDKATDTDDGLLTASEITQLKLDADWVILSACNTAAGDKPGAEPMSGLAKAFFYAGARALLISHWAVQSDATVALITKSFAARKQDPSLGRAGALRNAMLALINSKNMSHPEYWAPFIVVGEGN